MAKHTQNNSILWGWRLTDERLTLLEYETYEHAIDILRNMQSHGNN